MAKTVTVDEDILKAMQKQLAEQAKAIAKLQASLQDQQVKLEKIPQVGEAEHVAVVSHPGKAKIQVSLYGQVDKGVMFADDGNDSNTFFVDNDASSTRFGIKALAKPKGNVTTGAVMEMEYQTNPSNKVSMDDDSFNEDLHFRKFFVYVQDNNLGKISLGQAAAATDGIAEIDLSGTRLAGYSDGTIIGGGLSFFDDLSQSYSDTAVGSVFKNLDGGRYDLIRYDSPKMFGFSLAGSTGEKDKNEIALRYNQKLSMFKVSGGIGYATEGNGSSHDDRVLGSLSVLLDNGFNVTVASGVRTENDDQRADPFYFYGKLGYQLHAFSAGKTAFSVDYGSYQDFFLDNDEGTLFGGQVVQYFDDFGTQVYLGYRQIQLDQDLTSMSDIYTVISGFRVKF
jgi:hypothetical protein